jgi:hypothetical protein
MPLTASVSPGEIGSVRQSTMSKLPRLPTLLCALALATPLFVPATAYSSEASTIINRCTHGKSLGGFSQQAYRTALREVPTEISEYTNCSELIRKAQQASAGSRRATGLGGGVGGSGTGGGSSGAGPVSALAPTPTEQRAISNAGHVASTPLSIGKNSITPGVMHADIASAISSLPTPLLAMLIFLVASAVALTGGVVRDRVLTRRRI